MFAKIARAVFGTANDRVVKEKQKLVDKINSFEPELQKLSDEQLQAKTDYFRGLLADGKTLEDVLPESFAVVREASTRVLNMRHYDVQLIGGVILHQGSIAEMKTGEGKTLVATLAVYLNALEGKGVHVVSVNDYLIERDAMWMGELYKFLGLTVGFVTNNVDDEDRQAAYQADITYGTNNEFGFDYLRDNMKFSLEDRVMREFNFAIVDEVDSILIDESRTPLIISGPTEDSSELYVSVDNIMPKLVEADYEKDEKHKNITLTEEGNQHIEELLKEAGMLAEDSNLYDIEASSLLHHVNQALRAHQLFTNDVDYMVVAGKVMIIDEFTGRAMEGRRFSEGLHQALEAKERVTIQNENQTLASVTFQNYFRLYPKLAGMTGTAMTEANEFMDIYKLDVISIPTNIPMSRIDEDDAIYRTSGEKYDAILGIIKNCHERKQPILVGTVSIEQSELIAKILKKDKIPHNVLNAKNHEREAYIIAQAGRLGAVTIATNMAGRGTDIVLGGNVGMRIAAETANITDTQKAKTVTDKIEAEVDQEKQAVLEAGGLFVLGTERHESRRIDNQLRGRSGRQGDPGQTKFFLSLEDDLMRIFGSDRISGLLQRLGLKDGEEISHPMISRALEKAQSKVEAQNYEIRKNLLRFDDVMNDQRTVIYEQRIEIMESEDATDFIKSMIEEINEGLIAEYVPERTYQDQWDMDGLTKDAAGTYGEIIPFADWAKEEGVADGEILEKLNEATFAIIDGKDEKYGADIMKIAKQRILVMAIDDLWKDHLLALDHLRQGINLRAYGQRDPLNEYKREAFEMFHSMLERIKLKVVTLISHLELSVESQQEENLRKSRDNMPSNMHETRRDPAEQPSVNNITQMKHHVKPEDRVPSEPETWGKISRNEVCPCSSGLKYKNCHGKIA